MTSLRWLFDALNSVASSLATFLERNKKKGGLGAGGDNQSKTRGKEQKRTELDSPGDDDPKPQGFALMEKKEK